MTPYDTYLLSNVMTLTSNNPATQTKRQTLLVATADDSSRLMVRRAENRSFECSGVNPVSHLQGFQVSAAQLSGCRSCAFLSPLVATIATNRAFSPGVTQPPFPLFHESGAVSCAPRVLSGGASCFTC
jgi:hypothetical protein